jgi:nucleotide-binding universal stress UspA family protein
MKTIIVPLDGSAIAEQVLPHVGQLAATLAARVHLLVVITDAQKQRLIAQYAVAPAEAGGHHETVWQWEQRAQAELAHVAEDYLTAQAQALRAVGLDVTFAVMSGAPAERIADIAASEPEALIAMATHGYSGLRRWTLGSVADKVVHAATTPCFLVRAVEQAPSSVGPWKRILVPLDGSTLAEQALPLAIELARNTQAEVIALQVILPLAADAPGFSPFARLFPPSIAFPDGLREQAHQQLATTINRFAAHKALITPVVVFGVPAEEIINEAVQHHVDLIVMATHGYSGLRRWALGSVADKLLHASTVPLLLVRPQPGQGEARASTHGH